jgi:hypothetical protein
MWDDAAMRGHVVAMGGYDEALVRRAVALPRRSQRVLDVPAAVVDDPENVAARVL